jgi:histidinol-phosphate aminotransferase
VSLRPYDTGSDVRIPAPAPGISAIERLPEGGEERHGSVPLDRNERLSPLPESVIEELRAGISSELLTEYPVLDGAYADLQRAVGLPRDRLLLTAGSDAAFKALHHCYVRPGDRVVMLDPSYAMYAVYARMFEASAVTVPVDEDLSVDPELLLDAIAPDTRLVLLANPNQPTGTTLAAETVSAVIDRAADAGALVLVDEAYFPFSRTTVLPEAGERANLVVTRTFSKAWGLAGARIGFAAAHPEVVRTLFKVRSVYDVTALSAHCLRVMLAHPEVSDDYVAEVDGGRDLLVERARSLGLEPYECQTNFLPIRLRGRADPAALVAGLTERGYLVKGPFGAPCLRDYIRVTLGAPALMASFADALAEALEAPAR